MQITEKFLKGETLKRDQLSWQIDDPLTHWVLVLTAVHDDIDTPI